MYFSEDELTFNDFHPHMTDEDELRDFDLNALEPSLVEDISNTVRKLCHNKTHVIMVSDEPYEPPKSIKHYARTKYLTEDKTEVSVETWAVNALANIYGEYDISLYFSKYYTR